MKKGLLGFTLVELLIVIAIFAVLAGIAVVGFQNYARYQNFDQEIAAVQATIADTKVKARSSENGEAHGIKVTANTLTVFSGATYSAIDPDNEVYTFDAITLTPTFTGGTDEIIFANLTGLPSATGTVLMTGVYYSATRTVEVTGTGVIQ